MRRPRASALLAACCALASACSRPSLTLQGAGAPSALLAKWSSEFARAPSAPARIAYVAADPVSGLRRLNERAVDFGAISAPLSDEQLARATGRPIHVPVSLGAVAVAYHLPGPRRAPLRLDAAALSDIYLGRLDRWDDARLAALNPGAALPALPITVVGRADGRETTAPLLDYLSRASPEWRERALPEPGAEGGQAAAERISSTPGALGGLELADALRHELPAAALRNEAGEFVAPSLESMAAAASSAARLLPADLRASLAGAPGPQSYPLSCFLYVLVDRDAPQPERAAALGQFLWWAVHDGQRFAPGLHRAPLPPEIVARAEARLQALRGASAPLTLLTAPPL